MLPLNDLQKVLNKNKSNKRYSATTTNQIRSLLYVLGEIAYEQFKQTKTNEKGNNLH